jgi:hypothetical protein
MTQPLRLTSKSTDPEVTIYVMTMATSGAVYVSTNFGAVATMLLGELDKPDFGDNISIERY